jgi:hypothetical protein
MSELDWSMATLFDILPILEEWLHDAEHTAKHHAEMLNYLREKETKGAPLTDLAQSIRHDRLTHEKAQRKYEWRANALKRLMVIAKAKEE